jgi:uncharacterized protein (TIGR02246 family)
MNARHFFAPVALTLLLLAFHQPVAAQLSAEDEAVLRSMVDARFDALFAGDAATYVQFFREDGVLHPTDEPAVRGRAALADWARAWRANIPAEAKITLQNVRFDGEGSLAYGTVEYVVVVGDAPPNRGKQVTVWRKDASGRWEVVALSFNSDSP